MNTATLISGALRSQGLIEPIKPTAEGVCCLTGERGPAVDRKTVFGKSFTAQHLFAAPESKLVSVAAAEALGYKWERMSCWFATETEFMRIGKAEARDIILMQEYPEGWWAGYITTGYKKHGALTTPCCRGNRPFWGFDELPVNLTDFPRFKRIYDLLLEAKRKGIPQPVLETLEADPALILKYGVREWKSLVEALKPDSYSVRYRFALYLLPSHDELKKMEVKTCQE